MSPSTGTWCARYSRHPDTYIGTPPDKTQILRGKTNRMDQVFRRPTGAGQLDSDGRGSDRTEGKHYGQWRIRRRRAALTELGRIRQHTEDGHITDEYRKEWLSTHTRLSTPTRLSSSTPTSIPGHLLDCQHPLDCQINSTSMAVEQKDIDMEWHCNAGKTGAQKPACLTVDLSPMEGGKAERHHAGIFKTALFMDRS